MSRCHICNFSDFSASDCHDLSDEVPGRNSVHYRKELKEDICSYCYRIIVKNRKFYAIWARDVDDAMRMPKQQQKAENDNRPKQKDNEKPPALFESKVLKF